MTSEFSTVNDALIEAFEASTDPRVRRKISAAIAENRAVHGM